MFEGLEISKENELCDAYMGKFPVISISLKGVAGLDFDKAQGMLSEIICAEVRRHSYLIKSEILDQYDKQKLEVFLLEEKVEYVIDHGRLILPQMLQKHFHQKVVILIDEYDVPLAKTYEYSYYDKMVILIRNVLHQTLKTNEGLQFAVLVGCMRIAKESIFTELNNLKV